MAGVAVVKVLGMLLAMLCEDSNYIIIFIYIYFLFIYLFSHPHMTYMLSDCQADLT